MARADGGMKERWKSFRKLVWSSIFRESEVRRVTEWSKNEELGPVEKFRNTFTCSWAAIPSPTPAGMLIQPDALGVTTTIRYEATGLPLTRMLVTLEASVVTLAISKLRLTYEVFVERLRTGATVMIRRSSKLR